MIGPPILKPKKKKRSRLPATVKPWHPVGLKWCRDCHKYQPIKDFSRHQPSCRESRNKRLATGRAERRINTDKTCLKCGAAFRALKRVGQKFCTVACQRKFQEEKRWIAHLTFKELVCPECGTQFKQRTRWQKYCTKRCTTLTRDRGRNGDNTQKKQEKVKPPWLPGFTEPSRRKYKKYLSFICQSCGRKFKKDITHARAGEFKFCTKLCAYRKHEGAGHPNYRGGSCDNKTRGAGWILARAEAQKLAPPSCPCCGAEFGTKHIDHVVPYRLMKKWGMAPHNQENLLALCGRCHPKKTAAERQLIRGDVIGFVRAVMKFGYPADKLRSAFEIAGMRVSLE